MSATRSRWGIWLFSFSILLIATLAAVQLRFVPGESGFIHTRLVRWLGIGFSTLALLSGHFSYPRVYNLKVYLAGYLTGLCGISFFLLYNPSQPAVLIVLYLLIFINFLVLMMVPSYVKYRTTKYLTLSMTGAEAAILFLVSRQPQLAAWTAPVQRIAIDTLVPWISLIWAALIVVFSAARLREEFYLGATLAGTALFYAFGWASPLIFIDYAPFERMMFTAAAMYLVGGIMIHWFSRMEHRVSYDPLLHIYNRTFCAKIIEEQSSVSTSPPFGVAMVDIDHFKKVNDTHGHQAGDCVLYHVAQTISREVVPEGIVCRYGGEEIAIFFPRKRIEDIIKIMERVRKEVGQLRVHSGRKRLKVTVSCGISQREDRSQSIEKVIESADKALYRAKKGGRNQVKTARVRGNFSGTN